MKLSNLIFLCVLVFFSPGNGKSVSYKYMRAVPCGGRYSPGGVYSEYLRSMRMKTEVEITEDGMVKGRYNFATYKSLIMHS